MAILRELMSKLDSGMYLVPEIQRDFVWKNAQVRELMESIYNRIPMGSITVWEMPDKYREDFKSFVQPLSGHVDENGHNNSNGRYMVIDGRQRLTSLLLLRHSKLWIDGEERELPLYFDPSAEQFRVLSGKRIPNAERWFRVSEVLKADDLVDLLEERTKKFGETEVVSNRVVRKNLARLRDAFNGHEVNLFSTSLGVETKDGAELDPTDLFERMSKVFVVLNSKGTKIRMPDLVMALVAGKMRKQLGKSFPFKVKQLLEAAEKSNWSDIDETLVVRLFLTIATGRVRFAEANKSLNLRSAQELESVLTDVETALSMARDLLREFGFRGSRYFYSKYLFIPLAYGLHRHHRSQALRQVEKNMWRRWLVSASLRARYSGGLESNLDSDINAIAKGGVRALLDSTGDISAKVVDLQQELEEEADRTTLSLLTMLYSSNNAPDWAHKGTAIPIFRDVDVEDLSEHHIFRLPVQLRQG